MHLRPSFRNDQSNIIRLIHISHYSYYFIRSLAIRIRRIQVYTHFCAKKNIFLSFGDIHFFQFSAIQFKLGTNELLNTEAKRCFATHDEQHRLFQYAYIYYFNRMRIYSTVQLCSITSLWHSGQHLCRAIGRLQVRISLGFWLLSKRRSL